MKEGCWFQGTVIHCEAIAVGWRDPSANDPKITVSGNALREKTPIKLLISSCTPTCKTRKSMAITHIS